MGIYHFAGLGKSPGAVTAGLCYVNHLYSQASTQYGNVVDGLVLFTSEAVASGQGQGVPYSGQTYNRFFQTTLHGRNWAANLTNSVEIVKEFMHREFQSAEVYLVETEVNVYDDCFDMIGRALVEFHRPGHTDKHIWVNMTGGTNVLNMALIQAAYLSGVVARLYYTFVANIQEHGKYLRPFSQDESQCRYGETFPFKTTFGRRHVMVLKELKTLADSDPDAYYSGEELLSRLQQRYMEFADLKYEHFKTDFLNVMEGRSMEQMGDRITGQKNRIRINDSGCKLLEFMQRPVVRALVEREQLEDHELDEVKQGLVIKRIR